MGVLDRHFEGTGRRQSDRGCAANLFILTCSTQSSLGGRRVRASVRLDAATSERALPIEGVARQVMTTLPNNATAVRPDSVYTSDMSVVLVL